MLDGFTPWAPEVRAQLIADGWWENRSIADMVRSRAAACPDKIALVEDGAPDATQTPQRQLTYAQLCTQVDALACALLKQGIRPQDRVIMQLPNCVEFVVLYLALTRMGAIPVMALANHRHTEVKHFIQSSTAVAYAVADTYRNFDYRPLAAQLKEECASLKTVLVLGAPDPNQPEQIALQDLIHTPLSEADQARLLDAVHIDPCDVATMLLSGGTTSMSKLIPRTHNDYVLNARLCGAAAGFGPDTVYMALLPLGHNYNLASPGILATFYYGGTVVIGTGMDAATVFALVAKHRVSVIAAVIPLITQWLDAQLPAAYDLSSLKVIQNGGACLAPELRQRLRQQFGCIPQEVYGTAEGLINMTRLDDPQDLLMHSSGAPVCDLDEIKIVDDNDVELPDGQAGELLTRGPYTIQGYYNAPEQNAAAFTPDGFYRMGDICTKRGRYVFAEGRRKDLINRGGEKISCEEVENLIFKHPAVAQVALVAMPDPVFGEKACAFVVLKPNQPAGQQLTHEELVAFLKAQQIASFKLPERLEVVERFPLSPVGKILKRQLRDMITAKIEAENQHGTQS